MQKKNAEIRRRQFREELLVLLQEFEAIGPLAYPSEDACRSAKEFRAWLAGTLLKGKK